MNDLPEDKPSKTKQIRSALYETNWTDCVLSLSSGEHVIVPHRDFVLLAPESEFLLLVRGNHFRVIFVDQIVSVDVSVKKATKTNP